MNSTENSNSTPKNNRFNTIAWIFTKFIKSLKNFLKSSFLSLLVIGIVLLLLIKMDQAMTLLIALVEGDSFSFLLMHWPYVYHIILFIPIMQEI